MALLAKLLILKGDILFHHFIVLLLTRFDPVDYNKVIDWG
tara:strand:- start:365 stop:484 length:120 start_codon:yes stop_codon:yes gene_type:complete